MEGWKETYIKDEFYLGRGRVISQVEIEKNLGIYPVYSSQSTNKGEMGKISTFDFEGEYITWTTDGAYAGTVFYREGKFNCTNVCGTLKAIDETKISHNFVAYLLSTLAKNYVSYVGNPKLMNGVMALIPICIPETLTEQRQIAEILTTLDDAIQQTEQVIAKYKNVKKGLMHDLLNYGIDENGTIRSPRTHSFIEKNGLIVPEEWEVEEIGKVVRIEYGKSQKAIVSENGSIPIYGTGGIMEFGTKPLWEKESILIGRKGTIDKPFYINTPFWAVDTTYYVYSFNNGCMKWLFYFVQSMNLKSLNEATGVPSLSRQTFYNQKITLPLEDEQKKIVQIIEAQDELITAEENKLSKLLKTKQGLMHDLLTGKVRLIL